MIQIRSSGEVISSSEANLKRLRRAFARNHYVILPCFFPSPLLKRIQSQIACAKFYTRIHGGGIAKELCMRRNETLALLFFLVNDPRLFHLIQQITGCGQIGSFIGRVYQLLPGSDHYGDWHDDLGKYRMNALSINLSPGVYKGGALQLRDRNSHRVFHEVHNPGCGDALLFKISPTLEHRIDPVEGKNSKFAFAGWFRSKPKFWRTSYPV